jgi:hypothetical protein
MKTLLQVVGVLLAVGGLVAGWMVFEATEDIRKQEQEISNQHLEMANPGARGATKERGKQIIAESEREIQKKKTERIVWGVVAAIAFVGGLCMALLPSGKRKRPAGPAPAPSPGAPAP